MLNVIWVVLLILSVVIGLFTGKLSEVVLAAIDSAKFGFNLAFGLTAMMCLWLGIMKIAEAAGLIRLFARGMQPLLRKLFPELPADHPAMGSMIMNFSANLLGLNNAATPFGLRAMEQLEKCNPLPGVASNTMCTFVALHSSNMQLVPTGAIALLAISGADHPTDIVIPLLLSSVCTVFAAIVISRLLERLPWFRLAPEAAESEEGAA